MNKALFLVVAVLLAFYPIQSFAQDLNSWGSTFDCGVDWFSQCKAVRENRTDEPSKLPAARAKYFFAFWKVHCCEPATTREERP